MSGMYDGVAGMAEVVHGTYSIESSSITITTDTGQRITAHGEGVDRLATNLGIQKWSHGLSGSFAVTEQTWDRVARGSFR